MSCFCISEINPLSVASFANIFSYSEGCPFILFMAGQPSNHTVSADPGANSQSLCFSNFLEGIWLRGGAGVTWSLFASLKNSFTQHSSLFNVIKPFACSFTVSWGTLP